MPSLLNDALTHLRSARHSAQHSVASLVWLHGAVPSQISYLPTQRLSEYTVPRSRQVGSLPPQLPSAWQGVCPAITTVSPADAALSSTQPLAQTVQSPMPPQKVTTPRRSGARKRGS